MEFDERVKQAFNNICIFLLNLLGFTNKKAYHLMTSYALCVKIDQLKMLVYDRIDTMLELELYPIDNLILIFKEKKIN